MTLPEQLLHIRQSLAGIYPELFLTVFLFSLLLCELITKKTGPAGKVPGIYIMLNWAGAIVSLVLTASQWFARHGFLFDGFLFIGPKEIFYKILIILAWLFTLFHLQKLKYEFPAELRALLAAAVLGACLLCMSTNLLMIYLCVELLSLSSYMLVTMAPYPKASEGGLKYLLFGAVSSAVMLYGISLIYGLTGTLDIADENLSVLLSGNPSVVIYATLLLTFGGLLFKLSLVPFHGWTPDVYEAAPTPVVSFLSVVPKIAVLLVVFRLVHAFPAESLPLLGGVALLSMTMGNVAALRQRNARRLLAYSTIAQAGYLMVGVVAFSRTGFETATFYLAAYLLLNMASFFLIDLFMPRTETDLKGFEGKGPQFLIAGIALTMMMAGLAGLPPTVGFTAKLLVFSALWEGYQLYGHSWMPVLLIGGILNAAIALAYYVKIPYLMFFRSPAGESPASPGRWNRLIAGILLTAVVLLFIKPDLLQHFIRQL